MASSVSAGGVSPPTAVVVEGTVLAGGCAAGRARLGREFTFASLDGRFLGGIVDGNDFAYTRA